LTCEAPLVGFRSNRFWKDLKNKNLLISEKARSTLDDSVLELFQKDLVTLYDLKEPLLREGLIDYSMQSQ